MKIDDIGDQRVRELYVRALNEYHAGEIASEVILWPELERLWDGDHSAGAYAAVRDALLVLETVRRRPELASRVARLGDETAAIDDDDVTIEEFEDAIRSLHGCEPSYVETVSVRESLDSGEWEGPVRVFALQGHRSALHCYAWSYALARATRRFVAVLESSSVNSAVTAVGMWMLHHAPTGD